MCHFQNKKLLRFHNLPVHILLDLLESGKVTGERSVEKATKTSPFVIDSCKLLDVKKI